MPLHPTWDDIALRLILTILAGGIIGFNRGARGHAAGLRTTMLVGLAASVAMIQAPAPTYAGIQDSTRHSFDYRPRLTRRSLNQ